MRGVTCYFCHMLESIDGPTLAHDGVLRAGIGDPLPNAAHASGYSPLRDRTRSESSQMCAICHANTYAEWQESLFSSPDNPTQHLSCGECHMTGRIGWAANVDGAPERPFRRSICPGPRASGTSARACPLARDSERRRRRHATPTLGSNPEFYSLKCSHDFSKSTLPRCQRRPGGRRSMSGLGSA